MNKVVKFEDTIIDMQIIDGTPMFELYAVGMALGYARSNGKSAGEHRVHPGNKGADIISAPFHYLYQLFRLLLCL